MRYSSVSDDDETDSNAEDDSSGVDDENGKDYKRTGTYSNREYDIFHSQFTYCARIRAGQGPKHEKSVGSKEKGAQSKSKVSKILSKQDDKGLVKEKGDAAQKDEKGKEKRSPAESKDRKKEQKQDKQKKSMVLRKGKPKETKHKPYEQKKGGGSVEKPKQKK
ncbi:hypothetical protein ANCDUO_10747 [Ancylostoma duodenale]|uniref:Uncharacterized protein n=1 Tax=Ancylostoma duodenale TaxID=51022 RepID=A0A0C2GPY6_9BILA|nr:hypothetical protein ANCDUO_10747 [Ancylostoma duodenale]